MEILYSIGEIAKIFKVSIDTLRYYDKLNLIKPWHVADNGYRYYSEAQFDMISTILFLKSTGISLEQLQTILRQPNTEKIKEELLNSKQVIQEKIKSLQQIEGRIERMYDNIQDVSGARYIRLEQHDNLWILSQTIDEHKMLDIKEVVRINQDIGQEWLSCANVMSTISKENLLKGCYHSYLHYGFISDYPYNEENKLVQCMEPRLYVCANAEVERLGHEDIDSVYGEMLAFIKENNLEIVGETIERNMLDLYSEVGKESKHYYKIYIPVKIN